MVSRPDFAGVASLRAADWLALAAAPTFAVMGAQFDGLARQRGHEIARPAAMAAGNVLGGRDQPDDVEGQTETRDGAQHAENAAGPAHAELHAQGIAARGL